MFKRCCEPRELSVLRSLKTRNLLNAKVFDLIGRCHSVVKVMLAAVRGTCYEAEVNWNLISGGI